MWDTTFMYCHIRFSLLFAPESALINWKQGPVVRWSTSCPAFTHKEAINMVVRSMGFELDQTYV